MISPLPALSISPSLHIRNLIRDLKGLNIKWRDVIQSQAIRTHENSLRYIPRWLIKPIEWTCRLSRSYNRRTSCIDWTSTSIMRSLQWPNRQQVCWRMRWSRLSLEVESGTHWSLWGSYLLTRMTVGSPTSLYRARNSLNIPSVPNGGMALEDAKVF